MAWGELAIQYSNLGETARSRESAVRAYQARDRASGPEKFNIEYSYHRNVTGDLEKAWQSVSLWRQTYPRDSKAFSLSGGYAANGTGRFEDVLAMSAKSIELEPDQLRRLAHCPLCYEGRMTVTLTPEVQRVIARAHTVS